MLPFPFGIMVPIFFGSLAIVSWALATSKPAPEDDDAEMLRRLSRETGTDAETQVERTKTGPAIVRKVRKIG
jgi:hypothetical protein